MEIFVGFPSSDDGVLIKHVFLIYSRDLASQVDRRLFCLKMNIKLPEKCVKNTQLEFK